MDFELWFSLAGDPGGLHLPFAQPCCCFADAASALASVADGECLIAFDAPSSAFYAARSAAVPFSAFRGIGFGGVVDGRCGRCGAAVITAAAVAVAAVALRAHDRACSDFEPEALHFVRDSENSHFENRRRAQWCRGREDEEFKVEAETGGSRFKQRWELDPFTGGRGFPAPLARRLHHCVLLCHPRILSTGPLRVS